MTDERDDVADFMNDPDVDLVLQFVSGDLDHERIAEVRKRLEDDPVFRDVAAPIVYLWSTPPYWQRATMPPKALEESWDAFTKEAGFAHQRRKKWLRRIRIGFFTLIGVIVLSITGYVNRHAIAERWTIWRLTPISHAGAPFRLCDGSTVTPTKGLKVRAAKCVGHGDEVRLVWVSEGNARFRINLQETFSVGIPRGQTRVRTPAGEIRTHKADVQVSLTGDTMTVFVFPHPVPPGGMLSSVGVLNPRTGAAVQLNEGQAGRIVRGGDPLVIP